MLDSILNTALSGNIAIDLGTDTTLIYMQGKGIVLKEPSVVAYNINSNKTVAVGAEAANMIGKEPECIKTVRPITSGVISDFDKTVEMLKMFISSVYKKTVLKPRAIVCVPADTTFVERKAFYEAVCAAGVREVFMIEESLAAATGAGCDISLARGMLIADIGAGRCDISSISLGHSVISKSITTAGDTITDDIIKYVKNTHSLNIGIPTAESIKKEIGCVIPREKSAAVKVYGCDVLSGAPKSVMLSSEEIRDIIVPSADKISMAIRNVLEDTPPELQSDISEDGMLITGGGALLYGIDKYIKAATGIKTFLTPDTVECAVLGAGAELSKLNFAKSSDIKYYFSIYSK